MRFFVLGILLIKSNTPLNSITTFIRQAFHLHWRCLTRSIQSNSSLQRFSSLKTNQTATAQQLPLSNDVFVVCHAWKLLSSSHPRPSSFILTLTTIVPTIIAIPSYSVILEYLLGGKSRNGWELILKLYCVHSSMLLHFSIPILLVLTLSPQFINTCKVIQLK